MTRHHFPSQLRLVGPKLRELRLERGWSQARLAGRVGLRQSDLSRMEQGHYQVSLDALVRLLAEFRLPISAFFDTLVVDSLPPRQLRLMRELRALPEAERRRIEQVIDRRGDGLAPIREAREA